MGLYEIAFLDKRGNVVIRDIVTAKSNNGAKKIFLRNRIKVKKVDK